MVSKSDYTQNGRKHFNPNQPKKPGKISAQNDLSCMFNASQIPCPIYMDFSIPTPPLDNKVKPTTHKQANNHRNFNAQKNTNWPQNNHRMARSQEKIMKNSILRPPGVMPPPLDRFDGGHFNPNMAMPRRPRLLPPPHIPPVGGIFKAIPNQRLPIHPSHNMLPPPLPPFMRRGGGVGPGRPLPPIEMSQRNRRNRIGGNQINSKSSPLPRGNPKGNIPKSTQKSRKPLKPTNKYMMITLSEIETQYHMDKPFVNDEIRAEYDKKVDIENRLKGIKDDKLFADFKKQRDKFVALYDKAREKYLSEQNNSAKATTADNGPSEKDDEDQTKNMNAGTGIKDEQIQ